MEDVVLQSRKRVGEQVRSLRVASGLTQADLAKVAGVSAQVVWKLENGAPVKLDALLATVNALGRAGWLGQLDPVGEGPTPMERLRLGRQQPPQRRRVRKATS